MPEAVNRQLEQVISRMGDLPALPSVVAEVLQITENPNSAMNEVSQAVHSDPALTAKILRLSNSSYYGMRQQVGTLKLALVILGVREVRNIVLGISVFETLKDKHDNLGVAQEIWAEALCVAGMAKRFAETIGLGLQGGEFVAGLLTNIGKMVLLRQLKGHYPPLFEEYRMQPRLLMANELAQAGFTHADAAAALAVRWNLPRTLCDALWHQYPHEDRPLLLAKDPKLAAVVRIARAVCSDDLELDDGHRFLEDTEAWDALESVKLPMAPEDRLALFREFKSAVATGETLQL